MQRIKDLGRYQKGLLLVMAAMILVFTVVYPVTIGRVGFAYGDTILVPSQEGGNTVYSGKMQGEQARFAVSPDKTVTFQYGGEAYGPYTAREDPSAVPEDMDFLTGVEVLRGEEVLFRGGVEWREHPWLYNEDGSLESMGFSVTVWGGTDGNVPNSMEPSVSAILELMAGPELTHKGDWFAWFGGVAVCLAAAVLILFADELFRWNLSFQILHADRAEPSGWEMASRYITWTLLAVAALIIFLTGLS